MRLVIDVDGAQHDVEVARIAETATLADLIEASSGVVFTPDETVWVDAKRHVAGDPASAVCLLEGSRVARSALPRPQPLKGWTATLSGGLQAGLTVSVPRSRPLVVGRSPQADVTVDSPSVSRSHYTVEREGDGVRVRDDGSKNGTFLDGVEVPPEGLRIEGGEAVVLAGGVAITLRRDFGEILAPAPGTLHNLTPARTAPYNRPPRPGRPPPPEPVRSPVRKDPPPPTHFGIAAFVGPLLLAFAMVLVMGRPPLRPAVRVEPGAGDRDLVGAEAPSRPRRQGRGRSASPRPSTGSVTTSVRPPPPSGPDAVTSALTPSPRCGGPPFRRPGCGSAVPAWVTASCCTRALATCPGCRRSTPSRWAGWTMR